MASRRGIGAGAIDGPTWGRLRGATLGVLALALGPGCIIETSAGGTERDTDGESCGGARCSNNAFCRDDECVCEVGYLGDPYAEFGCQPAPDDSPCGTTCGLNAICDTGECVCLEGFVSCGTKDCIAAARLCDGMEDCPDGSDEGEQRCTPSIEQTYLLTDGCDDGLDVEYRLWAEQRDWVWPGPADVFITPGFGLVVAQVIECIEGELVCVGARTGDLVYGVDLDASLSCDDCCFACDQTTIDFGSLGCG